MNESSNWRGKGRNDFGGAYQVLEGGEEKHAIIEFGERESGASAEKTTRWLSFHFKVQFNKIQLINNY